MVSLGHNVKEPCQCHRQHHSGSDYTPYHFYFQEVDISHGFSNPRALDTAASPGMCTHPVNQKIFFFYKKLTLVPTPPSGGRLNKKDGLTRYGDSHVKDKTS